jgi:polysaccharide deacetylase 2 family uncharacterized protein YibQ
MSARKNRTEPKGGARRRPSKKHPAKRRAASVFCALVALSFAGCLGVIALRREAGKAERGGETALESERPAPEKSETRVEPAPERPVAEPEPAAAAKPLSENPPRGEPKPEIPSREIPTIAAAAKPQPPVPMDKPVPSPYDSLPDAAKGATLVFVFDDAGQNLSHLASFLTLPFPLTVAVLPRLPYSSASAERIRAAGKEVILHQPMQARDRAKDPGPGAISPDMGEREIMTIAQKNIAEIAPVAGMNNHEGSLITESREAMGAVLDVCRAAGIYFLDSRTTAETAVPAAARERGMNVPSRDVFLDNTPSKDDMLNELTKGLKIANRTGSAIMIGHVWSPALAELLRELYPVLSRKGYTFSTISRL